MKYIKFLMLVSLLFPTVTSAKEHFFRYGVGVMSSARNTFSETKIIGLGFQERTKYPNVVYKIESGAWIDSTEGQGRSGSIYSLGGVGLDIQGTNLRIQSLHGLTAISNPDSYLGGPVQGFHEVCGGIPDRVSTMTVSLCYQHFSSGGVFKPNIGRDFGTIKISF